MANQAVQEYLTTAIAGTQQLARQIRSRVAGSMGAAHPPITVGTGTNAAVYVHNGRAYVNAKTGAPLDTNLLKPGP
jgi:hypothetical protein